MLGNVPVGEHSISIKFTTKVNEKEVENQKKVTVKIERAQAIVCLLYTSDAADERSSVDLGGRRIIKKKKNDNLLCISHSHITNRT